MKSRYQRLGTTLGGRVTGRISVLALLLGGIYSSTAAVQAQDPTEITALYGRGVHAFFSGQSSDAEQMLTDCILAGSLDPRVYYFRGVVLMRQGRSPEAEADFLMGATLEARDPGRRYAIGNALQRIQGSDRITLEEFRRQARVDKVQERRVQTRARYENLQSRESDVLHHGDPVPLEQLVEPSVEMHRAGQTSSPRPSATQPSAVAPVVEPAPSVTTPGAIEQAPPIEDDLFGAPKEPVIQSPAMQEPATVPESAPEDDLFGPSTTTEEPAAEKTAPAEESDDLFSDPAPAIDPGATTEPAPAMTEEDPFGSDEGEATEADPFGAQVPAEGSPNEVPYVEEPEMTEATEADPFGGVEEAGPVETPPAVAAPVEEAPADDPFGAPPEEATEESAAEVAPAEETPAEPATPADDPFGATEEAAPAEDPFATESEAEEAPETTEESAAEDPFGAEPSDSTDSTESTEDPFGVPAEDVEQETAEKVEDSDTEAAQEEVETQEEEDDPAETGQTPEDESTDQEGTDESSEVEDPFGGF